MLRPSPPSLQPVAQPNEWGTVQRACEGEVSHLMREVEAAAKTQRERAISTAKATLSTVTERAVGAVRRGVESALQSWGEAQRGKRASQQAEWAQGLACWQRERDESGAAWLSARRDVVASQRRDAERQAELHVRLSAAKHREESVTARVSRFRVAMRAEKLVHTGLNQQVEETDEWRRERCAASIPSNPRQC